MPSSENPKPEPLTRAYWRGLLGAFAVFIAYCLVNIVVDPTGEFGQSGRYAFNRAPPAAVVAHGEAGGNPAFFTRAVREARGDVFLLGTSRVWRGFDTCARPDVLRTAGSAWGVRELARMERTILNGRDTPATLLIEVGLPQDERAAGIHPVKAATSVALSPRTTLFSLQTIASSLGGAEASPLYAPCTPLAFGPSNWTEASKTLEVGLGYVNATPQSLQRGRENILSMADDADRICATSGVRHTLVFFSLPATPSDSPARAYDQIVRRNSDRIADLFAQRVSRPGGCAIRYANFASEPPGAPADQALWRDRDQWLDYTHFSPRLGQIALDALSARARERSAFDGGARGRQ